MRAVVFFTFAVCVSAAGCAAPSASDRPSPSATAEAAPPAAPQRGGGSKAGGPQQATATGIKPLTKTKFGTAITETTTTSLPAIVKDPDGYANKTVRTEGMVSAVCQAAGCWMQIADTSGKAHIKMAGHSFFVPRESSGHRAVVQGKVMAGKQKNACDSDGCGNQEVTQVEIEATGVEFID